MEKNTILVVDDEHDIRQDLSDILRDFGYHVREATNGKTGLQVYNEYSPNLIITDIYMPEVDGLELIKTVRAKNLEIPIFAISSGWEYLEVANLFGASKTFYKPVQRNLLLNSIHTILNESLPL